MTITTIPHGIGYCEPGSANIPSSSTVFKFVRAYIYVDTGRRSEAISILKELQDSKLDRLTPSYGIALIYIGLDEEDQALAWLERARTEHDPFLVYLNVDPNFDSLREDPRFVDLLRRIGFSV